VSKTIEAFGKYLLLERLASGGMAEVYLAKSVGAGGIGKFVAMKRILPQFSDNQEFIDMFKEEAKIVMNLQHSNVVSIFDFGIEHSQFFLVMEFVEGQNLRQTLTFMKKQAKYFSLDQIVYIAKEVATGLDHAHRCIDASTGKQLNITHRDISPQNIMLSFEGEVKIVDFGIAKAETQIEHTRSGTIKGKFGYMSPEHAEGSPVDARTDVFSLGIVLWELLAQDRLFTAQNEAATLRKIKECQIPSLRKLNPAVSPELEKIVNKALVRDKNLRYQTAEAFVRDLSRFLNTQYPDFSKQEFSKFMKSLYQDMYLENRKKLSEYAKIELPAQGEKTSITQTSTNAETPALPEPSAALPKNMQSENTQSQRIDLNKLKLNAVEAANQRQSLLRKTSGFTKSSSTRTSNTSLTSHSVVKKVPQQKPASSMGLLMMIVLGLSAGGWWYLQNQKRIERDVSGVSMDPERNGGDEIAPAQQPKANLPPKDVTLSIQSQPQGATVYIDDKPIGETPVLGHIPSGKAFRVRLVKEGYLPADSVGEMATDEGYKKSFNLMAEPPMGSITITSSNAGPNPVVYVNGQIVGRSLPLTTKILAGTPTSVKVVNPIGRTEGVEDVIVGQGQPKRVNILLNREAQIPQ